jgi:phenylpropionate dioxygenase-like ring-hydroxylating dioxygenase large terminal subunit
MSETAFGAPAPEIGVHEFRDWYRSSSVFEAEQERLFSTSWAIVAEETDLKEPGSFVATMVAGVPIVVIRGDDGELLAHENICRHRGIPLVVGTGRVGRYLTCPYHQWSFSRDGTLAVIPQRETEFPDIDSSSFGLRPVSVASWSGNVFVRPRNGGPTLHACLAGLDERLAEFDRPGVEQVAVVEIEAACNWKMLVENHVDVYHLWYLHQKSLRHYEHRKFEWESLADNWWSLEPLRDVDAAPQVLNFLSDRYRQGIGAHLIFPNIMVVTTGAYFATYEARPIAANRTLLTLRVRSSPGADAKDLVDDIRSFLAEDLNACEQLQTATGSRSYEFGPLSLHHEEPVRRFHESVRRVLGC